MRATALRGALVVAAVVLGAVIISNGFPQSRQPAAPAASTNSPTPTPPEKTTPPPVAPTCTVQGIEVAVENGTDVTGLAAATAGVIENKGYVPGDIGNAPSGLSTTVVYFNGPDNKPEAKCLRKKLLKTAEVKPLPTGTGLPATTDLAVYLGADYAEAHPTT